jgi:hypothetical protein
VLLQLVDREIAGLSNKTEALDESGKLAKRGISRLTGLKDDRVKVIGEDDVDLLRYLTCQRCRQLSLIFHTRKIARPATWSHPMYPTITSEKGVFGFCMQIAAKV